MQDRSNVDRVLAILGYLARNPGEHGVRALSAALDLSPSTVFRMLEALERAGFARQNPDTNRYSIGVQAVQLGLAALKTFDLTRVAPPHLQALVAESGESAFLAALDDGEVVYLQKEEGRYAIRTTAELGSRRPLHCTALGKSFLAAMAPDAAQRQHGGGADRDPEQVEDQMEPARAFAEEDERQRDRDDEQRGKQAESPARAAPGSGGCGVGAPGSYGHGPRFRRSPGR